MSNIKILVCFHKPGEMPSDSIYLPIQVGKSLTDLDLNIQTDNKVDGKDCDNISQWNNIFCELTADYWAWKNMDQALPEVDYIGLCHYRRYFDFNGSLKDLYSGAEFPQAQVLPSLPSKKADSPFISQ